MHRIYILTSIFLTAFAALCIIVFCFLIDPYNIYPSVGHYSPNRGVDLFYHLRLHKPYTMEKLKAKHLIIGSSRSARLNPEPLSERGEASYNASLPGVTLREMRQMIEHANAITPLNSVFIGLDYYMFRQGYSDKILHYNEARLLKASPTASDFIAYYFARFEEYFKSLFSIDALLNSADSLFSDDRSQRTYNENGTWETLNPSKPPKWLYSMIVRKIYQEYSSQSGALEYSEYVKLLDFLKNNKIPTKLFISPYHASLMNSVALTDHWRDYLEWQNQLVLLASHYGTEIEIFGIEDNATVVQSPMDTKSAYFHDGLHYTEALGTQVLDCLFVNVCTLQPSPQRLNEQSIANYLSRVDGVMGRYHKINKEDYALVRKWIKTLR